jgi:hypothetical protein
LFRFHVWSKRYPEYYLTNATVDRKRNRAAVVHCGAKGYGMYVFWSMEVVAVSWDDWEGRKWLFETWTNAFAPIMKSIGDEVKTVSHIDVCFPDGMLVAVNDSYIVIFRVERKESQLMKRKMVSQLAKMEDKVLAYSISV